MVAPYIPQTSLKSIFWGMSCPNVSLSLAAILWHPYYRARDITTDVQNVMCFIVTDTDPHEIAVDPAPRGGRA